MMSNFSKIVFISICLALMGCQPPAPPDRIEPVIPCFRDDLLVPDGEYRLSVLTPVLYLAPGTETEISVCVHRGLGMEAPVLLVAQGQPEYVEIETRENRFEDIEPTILRVRTASEEEAFGETPGPTRARRFTVIGSSGLEDGHEVVSVEF